MKEIAKFSAIVSAIALLLKVLLGIALINSALIVTGWVFIGHIVTIDDDFPGGWSNLFGEYPIEWDILAIKGGIFLTVLIVKFVLLAT